MFENLRNNFPLFLEGIFAFADELNLNVSNLTIDHAALRYANPLDVKQLAQELNQQADVLSDAIVNGRKIYTFKLHEPLIYKNRVIPCVELPFPATLHDYPDGWEHVEFVLPTEDIAEFEEKFKKEFPQLAEKILQKYHYTFAIPEVKGEQLPNPTVALTKVKGLSIKFHPNSIEKVVAS